MATDMITLKLDSKFLKEIDGIVAKTNYQNRTEFIREALRGKVDEHKLKELLAYYEGLRAKYGRTKKITDEEMEEARERAFEKLEKRFK